MSRIEILTSNAHIEQAYHILYKVYVEKMQWNFAVNNPSHLRVVIKNNKKLLVDRFVNNAVWFGAFSDDKLIGCARVLGVDENNRLEVEQYKNSKVIHRYYSHIKKCVELTKFAVLPEHVIPGITEKLFLKMFEFCEENNYSVIGCTSNNFLKNFFLRIKFPLKKERAFKYDKRDPEPVNFYFAHHESLEVASIISTLKINSLKKPNHSNKTKIFEALKIVAPVLPVPVYWHDRSGVVLGVNEHCQKAMGTTGDIVGKLPYEFYPKETADHILNHHHLVMDKGHILAQEEKINDITTGKIKYFSSIKAPLYDDDGSVVGIVGTSIEITDKKESERLKLENEQLAIENRFQNKLIKEQSNFKEIINQAVHDIRSPLASLMIVSKYTKDLPQEVESIITGASQRINDIANNLLTKYKFEEEVNSVSKSCKNNFQVSLALQEIVSEKKYEFYDYRVEFDINISTPAYMVFLYAEEISFKRMISNVINNAVEALREKSGTVFITLTTSDKDITIIIEDNGVGMAPHVIEKIMNGICVTDGKEEGYGIGFAQIRDTLQNNNGYLDIESKVNQGTKVILSFVKSPQPKWIVDKLELNCDDIIVVLDDDLSVHKAWQIRFREKYPALTLKCFIFGEAAMHYIAQFLPQEREKILFLVDYELLDQELNGLEVISKMSLPRSILVTSRFSSRDIQNKIKEYRIQMLPKIHISDVPICLL